ncbi:hypothetical protein FGRMN_4209 [Fusarium graminum]|nr:hypothetical protein FGRMN_4209 [Fusarium graminum]
MDSVDTHLQSFGVYVCFRCPYETECDRITCHRCMVEYMDAYMHECMIIQENPITTSSGYPSSEPGTVNLETQIRRFKRSCLTKFERVFSSCSPRILTRCVLEEIPEDGYDELQKGYMSWRMMWYMSNNSTSHDSRVNGPVAEFRFVCDELPTMNIWGDIMNDYALFSQGHLTSLDLGRIYGVDIWVVAYLATNRREWKEEIETIEDVVGLTLAGLSQESVSVLRWHLAMLDKTFQTMYYHRLEDNTEADNQFENRLLATARNQFKSLRIALCGEYLKNKDSGLSGLDYMIDLDTSSEVDALGC